MRIRDECLKLRYLSQGFNLDVKIANRRREFIILARLCYNLNVGKYKEFEPFWDHDEIYRYYSWSRR